MSSALQSYTGRSRGVAVGTDAGLALKAAPRFKFNYCSKGRADVLAVAALGELSLER